MKSSLSVRTQTNFTRFILIGSQSSMPIMSVPTTPVSTRRATKGWGVK